MRRALRHALPALAFHFGLHWSDIETMPHAELEAHLEALQEINKGG